VYLPDAFREDNLGQLHAAIRSSGLATLVTSGAEGLTASHIPLLLDPEPGPFGTLLGHVSRANPQWRGLDGGGTALAIFLGPEAYVSPTLYATRRTTGRVVPIWNYAAVHAYGRLAAIEDPERLLELVARLTSRHESGRPDPWSAADAPPDFIAAQLRGIVGLQLTIDRLEGKWKMSQNRPAEDIPGIVEGLATEAPEVSQLVARRNRGRQ
jgi:transcriptional regulator